jgi:ribosomal protein S18 acetylase RimI-like enzyme
MSDDKTNPPAPFRDVVLASDVEAVRALVAATGYFNDEEVAIAAELVAESLVRGAEAGYEYLFADVDGRVVGYSCYGLVPCSSVSWDLYWIAVHPDQQGGGLGKRLLRETEERVRRAGGLALYAETSGKAQYVSTRAFYERSGYETAGVFEDFYAVGDAKYTYCRRVG